MIKQWLLLGQAMKGSEPPHQIRRGPPDDLTICDFTKTLDRDRVSGVVELRHDEAAVDKQEVAIAAGQPTPLLPAAARDRQGHDMQRCAGFAAPLLQTL